MEEGKMEEKGFLRFPFTPFRQEVYRHTYLDTDLSSTRVAYVVYS
jgi:hypothetical protein